MDFKDQVKQLSGRVEKLKDNIKTEEATKNALIMPFLQSLGYDVFNPIEVVPEFTCDLGMKKGEKIDYAILKDGKPAILIECKHWEQDLTLHDNQLLRYFHASTAKFGILTNGIIYRFYTDLETPNKMDEKPFLEIDILDLRDNQVEELKKFHKSYFDVENIIGSASELKYSNELKRIINDEFVSPSSEFVKLFAKQVYDGIITAKVLEQFTGIMKKSLSGYVNDKITERLKSALAVEKREETEQQALPIEDVKDGEDKIATTMEEVEGYIIIKSIVRAKFPVSRILHKDTLNYFSIMIDNQRKTFCRLYFNGKNKYITTLDESKKEIRHNINTLDDIYNFSEQILSSADLVDMIKVQKIEQ